VAIVAQASSATAATRHIVSRYAGTGIWATTVNLPNRLLWHWPERLAPPTLVGVVLAVFFAPAIGFVGFVALFGPERRRWALALAAVPTVALDLFLLLAPLSRAGIECGSVVSPRGSGGTCLTARTDVAVGALVATIALLALVYGLNRAAWWLRRRHAVTAALT
jgi:hypothetical protein